jgi:hypothetical protein
MPTPRMLGPVLPHIHIHLPTLLLTDRARRARSRHDVPAQSSLLCATSAPGVEWCIGSAKLVGRRAPDRCARRVGPSASALLVRRLLVHAHAAQRAFLVSTPFDELGRARLISKEDIILCASSGTCADDAHARAGRPTRFRLTTRTPSHSPRFDANLLRTCAGTSTSRPESPRRASQRSRISLP